MLRTEYSDGTIVLVADAFLAEPRWKATVTYKTLSGEFTLAHTFDELEELQDIIEEGPNFYSIVSIEIALNNAAPTPLELFN